MTDATMTVLKTPRLAHFSLPRDPLGLVAGWRAYQTFSRLSDLSDSALAARGLARGDLARVAFDDAFKG